MNVRCKPKGYLTTYRDPEGRPTIYDLIQDLDQWVFAVGRLDLDTSGLLLLAKDIQFAERTANPAYKAPKTYLVKTASRLGEEQIEQLRRGVVLSDGGTQPAVVQPIRIGELAIGKYRPLAPEEVRLLTRATSPSVSRRG